MMANVIFRGPARVQPETVNLPVAGAYLPGTFVKSDGATLTQAADATGRLLLLSNRDMYTQGVTDAYAADETGVAYRIQPEYEMQAAFAAGTYTTGQELTLNASGQLTAAAATNLVVAFFDQAGATLTAGQLADVVIADTYTKA
jgi:hypothetical protein|tara:strand:- start:36743 stop:37174 length:432 start_codon:yes stop_codon:yes gene_type:complete